MALENCLALCRSLFAFSLAPLFCPNSFAKEHAPLRHCLWFFQQFCSSKKVKASMLEITLLLKRETISIIFGNNKLRVCVNIEFSHLNGLTMERIEDNMDVSV